MSATVIAFESSVRERIAAFRAVELDYRKTFALSEVDALLGMHRHAEVLAAKIGLRPQLFRALCSDRINMCLTGTPWRPEEQGGIQ